MRVQKTGKKLEGWAKNMKTQIHSVRNDQKVSNLKQIEHRQVSVRKWHNQKPQKRNNNLIEELRHKNQHGERRWAVKLVF